MPVATRLAAGIFLTQKQSLIFYAGTTIKKGQLITNSGHILGITNIDDNLNESLKGAYKVIEQIDFEDKQYRKDIGVNKV